MGQKFWFLLFGAVLLVAVTTCTVLSFAAPSGRAPDMIDTAVISAVDQTPVEGVGENKDLTILVTVNDPFQNFDTVGASLYTTDPENYSDIVSIMDFDVNIPMSVDTGGWFVGSAVGQTNMTSGEKISIMQRINFNTDATVVNSAQNNDKITWDNPAFRQSVPMGSQTILTFTSDDSIHWNGSVSTSTPTQ